MEGIAKKFRFGNLVVNLAPGVGAGVCPHYTIKFTPDCCLVPSKCQLIWSYGCGIFSPPCPAHSCGWTHCLGGSQPCFGSDLPFEKFSPLIQEVIPQITDHELIAVLRRDLEVALEAAKQQEAALTAAAKPQTLEEVVQIEKGLNKALEEVQAMKAKLKK
jgi:hypothetical protein